MLLLSLLFTSLLPRRPRVSFSSSSSESASELESSRSSGWLDIFSFWLNRRSTSSWAEDIVGDESGRESLYVCQKASQIQVSRGRTRAIVVMIPGGSDKNNNVDFVSVDQAPTRTKNWVCFGLLATFQE